MSTTLEALEAAYVAQMQRAFHSGTRAVATPEQRQAWGREFRDAIAQVKAEAQVEALREAAARFAPQAHVGWPHNVEVMEAAEHFEAILEKRADRIAREAGIETGEEAGA